MCDGSNLIIIKLPPSDSIFVMDLDLMISAFVLTHGAMFVLPHCALDLLHLFDISLAVRYYMTTVLVSRLC